MIMGKNPEPSASTSAPDECHQVLSALFMRWPEEPSDCLSSTLLDHLCQCRSCLRKWIALEAAADLASMSFMVCEEPAAEVDEALSHDDRANLASAKTRLV